MVWLPQTSPSLSIAPQLQTLWETLIRLISHHFSFQLRPHTHTHTLTHSRTHTHTHTCTHTHTLTHTHIHTHTYTHTYSHIRIYKNTHIQSHTHPPPHTPTPPPPPPHTHTSDNFTTKSIALDLKYVHLTYIRRSSRLRVSIQHDWDDILQTYFKTEKNQ